MIDDTEAPIKPVTRSVTADSTDNELKSHLGAKAGDIIHEVADRVFRDGCSLRDFRDPNTGQPTADYLMIDRWLMAARERQFGVPPEAQFRVLLALQQALKNYRAELVQQATDRATDRERAYAEQRRRDAPALLIGEFRNAGFDLALSADGRGLLLLRLRATAMLPPGHDIRLSEHRDAIVALLRERAAAAEAAEAWQRPIAVA